MAADVGRYLDRRADLAARPLRYDETRGLDGVDTVVAIPALAERAHLFETLDFLAQNPPDQLSRTLVICVVNNRRPRLAGPDALRDNQATLARLRGAVDEGPLRLGYVDGSSPGFELGDKCGVGTARKVGLDWGVGVLSESAGEEGVLVCLDADTRVEPSYLDAVRSAFGGEDAWAGVVDYAHDRPESGGEAAAVVCYELFLRYHVLGLEYAGSPYAFPTIGSTMACTVGAYLAVAGMNQREAGEDFYFLQQLAKTGRVRRIPGTTVHPSARASWRVPFGTGQRVRRFLGGARDEYRLYDPRCYGVLKQWLDVVAEGLEQPAEELLERAGSASGALRAFLEDSGFGRVWPGLKNTAPDAARRLAQFHRWFDGLKSIKLLHYLRDNGYAEVEMFGAIRELAECGGVAAPDMDWEVAVDDLEGQARVLEFLRGRDGVRRE